MVKTLTRRQRDVLKVVLEFFTNRGRLPTVRELAHELGFGSTSTAYSHLQALKRNGALREDNGHIALAPATLQTLAEALRDRVTACDPPQTGRYVLANLYLRGGQGYPRPPLRSDRLG